MKIRGFEIVSDKFRKFPDAEITLPTRASKHSAGYDFYSPVDIELQPGEGKVAWSDVKAYMLEDEVLHLYVRSSVGIKQDVTLKNGTGIIDSDYYSNKDNDGRIGIPLRNNSDVVVKIEAGERVAQGIFTKFLVADTGNTGEERNGGFGSSNKK